MRTMMLAAAFVALAATTAQAQVQAKRFSVTTRLGTVTPERSSSLDMAGLVGLDTEYSLNKYFGTGVSVDVTRGNTHREDFVARLRYGNANASGGGFSPPDFSSHQLPQRLGRGGHIRGPAAQ